MSCIGTERCFSIVPFTLGWVVTVFRILGLDGGGIKGIFTASVLASLEEQTGRRIADHFDLIAGTSTGGILAIGLGLGLAARDLLRFYRDRGPEIFPSTGLVGRFGWVRQMFGPKHSHEVLRRELTAVLGTRKFGESSCRLVIPAYDAIAGRIYVMKTAHHTRFVHEIDAPAVDVALATAAAPTYFAAARFPTHANASYVDGGVWANCPALVGVVEALAFLGARQDEVDVLSIGTTSEAFNIAQHRASGLLRWNKGLIDLMFEAQAEAARAQAALLAQGRFHRINIVAKAGQFSLDRATPQAIEALAALGRAEATKKEHIEEVVRPRFLNGQPAPVFAPSVQLGAPHQS